MVPILDNTQVFFHKMNNPLLYREDSFIAVREDLFAFLEESLPPYDRNTLRKERYSIVVKRPMVENIGNKTISTYKVTAINNIAVSKKYLFDTLLSSFPKEQNPALTPPLYNLTIFHSNLLRLGFL